MNRVNASPGPQQAALSGLALAAAVAVWWLGSTRLALDQGADPARASAQALQVLWVLRALALALLLGALGSVARGPGSWWTSAAAVAGLVAPAWPLVVLVASASTLPGLQVLLMEVALLVVGGVVLVTDHAVRLAVLRGLGPFINPADRHAVADAACTLWGVLLALGLWRTQDALGQVLGQVLAQMLVQVLDHGLPTQIGHGLWQALTTRIS